MNVEQVCRNTFSRFTHITLRSTSSCVFFCRCVPSACLSAPVPAWWAHPLVLRWPIRQLFSHFKLRMSWPNRVVTTFPPLGLWIVPLVRSSEFLVQLVHLLHVEVIFHVPVGVETLRVVSWVPASAASHPFTFSSLICRSQTEMTRVFLVGLPTFSCSPVGPIVIHTTTISPNLISLSFVLRSSQVWQTIPGAPVGALLIAPSIWTPVRCSLWAVGWAAWCKTWAVGMRGQRSTDRAAGARSLWQVAAVKWWSRSLFWVFKTNKKFGVKRENRLTAQLLAYDLFLVVKQYLGWLIERLSLVSAQRRYSKLVPKTA